MNLRNTLLVTTLIAVSLMTNKATAVVHSGWSVSSAYIWRLLDSADNSFTHGSPSKILQIDRKIKHRQAVFKVVKSITNRYDFKVGCLYQSSTPTFELSVPALDVTINDQLKGFVFARFLVDNGQEYSLRGQVVPPSRIIFAPFTKSQDKKISDIYLQLSEGAVLNIALLQGKNYKPRVYDVQLEGFFDLSDKILKDCTYLNNLAKNHRGTVALLPDYLTREPADAAPKDYTLRPKKTNDGLSNLEPPLETSLPKDVAKDSEKESPSDIKVFTPGGGAASIGDDGKPIMAKDQSSSDENLGEAKTMQIGDDGKPIESK